MNTTSRSVEPEVIEEPSHRFLVDENVASLARRLRWLGYDAIAEFTVDDGTLVMRAEAEGRTLLTRDRGILRRRPIVAGRVNALWIGSDDPWTQLAQVVHDLGIDAERYACTRCIRCNVLLEPANSKTAAAVVPPYVAETQTRFTRCPSCGRYFWRGTHWSRVRTSLEAHQISRDGWRRDSCRIKGVK